MNISWLPIVCILLAMIFVQSGASLAKQLFPLVGAAGTTSLRLIFSALFVNLFFKSWRHLPQKKNWSLLFAYGASLGLMNLFFYFAIRHIPLGLAVAFEFTGPFAVAIFSSRRLSDYVWIALAAIGLCLLTPMLRTNMHISWIGVGYALVAGFFWALYIIFGSKVSQHMSSGQAVSYGILCAALVAAPFGMIRHGTTLFELNTLAMGAAVALLSSALPYSLEMIALQRLPKVVFSILMSLEPAIAAVSGLLFLHEKLRLVQIVGILFVMIASAGITLRETNSNSES